MKLGINYMVFDGEELLEFAIKSIRDQVDFVSVIWQNLSYFGNKSNLKLENTINKLKQDGLVDNVTHYTQDLNLHFKQNELNIRNLGLDLSIENGCTHHISSDVDEFYLSDHLIYAKQEMKDHDCSIISIINYYKQPDYIIYPDQQHFCTFIHPVSNRYEISKTFPYGVEHTRRHTQCNNCKIFEKNEIVVHHMSYVRKDIKKKLENSSNGQFCNIKRICNEFDKYKLGGKLRVPPDLKIRKTILGKNLFNIKFEGVKWQEHQSQEKD